MKRILNTMLILIMLVGIPSLLSAKCYSFSNGGEYKACVHGDGFSDRKKARKNCSNAKGSDCGNVTSSSSSCHSNSGHCVDENGKENRSLSGY